jgi:2-amino-4-hydroxy-6-hydroxymethyldihydropteridine diphosphokinase
VRRSRWYRSAPVPPSDQPWYTNGVARIDTDLGPAALLALMLRVEERFGRRRGGGGPRFAARVLDLDLLAYGDRVSGGAGGEAGPILPHPRLHERAFVLLPLAEVAPAWRHPASGRSVAELIRALPPGQQVEPLDGRS